MNLFCHALKYRSEDQGWSLGNRDIVNIPRRTNGNVTKENIFINIQIEREDTEQWDTNNGVN